MASILQRFTAIIKANINEALDNAEDPAKMVDQYLRDLKSDLASVKNETASVMAEETRAKAALDKNNKEIEEMMKYAEAALAKGNEADARTFLERKAELTNNGVSLQETYNIAVANATKMREMHNKLVDDIKARIHSRIKAQRIIRIFQIVINGARNTDGRYPVLLTQDFCATERTISADNNKAFDAIFIQRCNRTFLSFFREHFQTSCRTQFCTTALHDI